MRLPYVMVYYMGMVTQRKGRGPPRGGHQTCRAGMWKAESKGSAGGGRTPGHTLGIQWSFTSWVGVKYIEPQRVWEGQGTGWKGCVFLAELEVSDYGNWAVCVFLYLNLYLYLQFCLITEEIIIIIMLHVHRLSNPHNSPEKWYRQIRASILFLILQVRILKSEDIKWFAIRQASINCWQVHENVDRTEYSD